MRLGCGSRVADPTEHGHRPFLFAQFISVGGFFFHLEWGYVIAFVFFIMVMFWKPEGLLARRG